MSDGIVGRRTWILVGVCAVVLLGLIVAARTQPGWRTYSTPAASMAPTLEVGDIFLAELKDAADPVVAGGVIVFTARDPDVPYVKRVIGLPGDRVVPSRGHRFHQRQAGHAECRGRLFGQIAAAGTYVHTARRYSEELPGGRAYSVIKLTDEGWTNNTPEFKVPLGNLFVLGDNRDNSLDSRFTGQFGYVALSDVLGRAVRILSSNDPDHVLKRIE